MGGSTVCARTQLNRVAGAFIAVRLFERARRTASVELDERPAKRCRLSIEMARYAASRRA